MIYELRLITLARPFRTVRVRFHSDEATQDPEDGTTEIVGPEDLRQLALAFMTDVDRLHYSPRYGVFAGGDLTRWGKIAVMSGNLTCGQQPLFRIKFVRQPEPVLMPPLPEGAIP
jgi:hypothetical protein